MQHVEESKVISGSPSSRDSQGSLGSQDDESLVNYKDS